MSFFYNLGGFINAPISTLPAQFGSGSDGAITVTGTSISIVDIYENDNVAGVTTWRGVGKGLYKGIGTYNPQANQITNTAQSVPNCTTFTINSGASLTAPIWAADAKKGIVWITCTLSFIDNSGATGINLNSLGGANGTGAAYHYSGTYGVGSGPGTRGVVAGIGGPGGVSYGSTSIPLTTWNNLYGSGGGGGSGASNYGFGGDGESGSGGGGAGGAVSGSSGMTYSDYNPMYDVSPPGTGGNGGKGGGAVRIYARNIEKNGVLFTNVDFWFRIEHEVQLPKKCAFI